MSVNEKIIIPVFKLMTEYQPRLARLLPQDDDDDDEIDSRPLAQGIISGFPWPIGIEFRRLFTDGCSKLDRGRLDQILRTVERITQFIAFVLLSQLLEESLKQAIETPDDFSHNFKTRFSTPGLGTYIWLIQHVARIFTTHAIEPFIPDMKPLLGKGFMNKLQPWSPIRNEISHYLVNLDEQEIQIRCYEYQENLCDLLSDIAFLVKYPLVTISEIRVNKRKRLSVSYRHNIKVLNNISSDLAGRQRSYDSFADNRSVYLDHFKPIYLIFDQFEELFIFGDADESERLARDLAMLAEAAFEIRVIFVIREEYLAELTAMEEVLHDLFANRLRIERMNQKDAARAIQEPLLTGQMEKAKQVFKANADKLVNGKPFAEAILKDFETFTQAGITHPNITRFKDFIQKSKTGEKETPQNAPIK